jgi:hypothetical protein
MRVDEKIGLDLVSERLREQGEEERKKWLLPSAGRGGAAAACWIENRDGKERATAP